jgi:hypothetical protein
MKKKKKDKRKMNLKLRFNLESYKLSPGMTAITTQPAAKSKKIKK